MIKEIIIFILALFLGIVGFAQIVGSMQNITKRPRLIITIILWCIYLSVGAYLAIVKFGELVPLCIGYVLSFVMVLAEGKIE